MLRGRCGGRADTCLYRYLLASVQDGPGEALCCDAAPLGCSLLGAAARRRPSRPLSRTAGRGSGFVRVRAPLLPLPPRAVLRGATNGECRIQHGQQVGFSTRLACRVAVSRYQYVFAVGGSSTSRISDGTRTVSVSPRPHSTILPLPHALPKTQCHTHTVRPPAPPMHTATPSTRLVPSCPRTNAPAPMDPRVSRRPPAPARAPADAAPRS